MSNRYEHWLESFDFADVVDAITDTILADVVGTFAIRPVIHRAIENAIVKMDGEEVAKLAVAFDVIGAFDDGADDCDQRRIRASMAYSW
jgi:hypothetical protein